MELGDVQHNVTGLSTDRPAKIRHEEGLSSDLFLPSCVSTKATPSFSQAVSRLTERRLPLALLLLLSSLRFPFLWTQGSDIGF